MPSLCVYCGLTSRKVDINFISKSCHGIGLFEEEKRDE